jgi:hypothetical protein
VSGELTVDDGGIRLETNDAIREPSRVTQTTREWTLAITSEPVIHGRSKTGECVTLLSSDIWINLAGGEHAQAMACLTGREFAPGDNFTDAVFELDCLQARHSTVKVGKSICGTGPPATIRPQGPSPSAG